MRRSSPSLLLVMSGMVGVVLAHAAASLLALPSAGLRQASLQESGHGYWHHAVAFAAVAGTLSLGLAIGRGVRRGLGSHPGDGCSLAGRLRFLWLYQVVFFIGMEAGERFLAGVPLGTLVSEPGFLIGLVLQVAVATALLLVLEGVEHVASEVARRLQGASAYRPRRVTMPPPPPAADRQYRTPSPAVPRGPPLSPCRA